MLTFSFKSSVSVIITALSLMIFHCSIVHNKFCALSLFTGLCRFSGASWLKDISMEVNFGNLSKIKVESPKIGKCDSLAASGAGEESSC